jgi:hypothetical protein
MVRCGFPERRTPVRNGFSETLDIEAVAGTSVMRRLYGQMKKVQPCEGWTLECLSWRGKVGQAS